MKAKMKGKEMDLVVKWKILTTLRILSSDVLREGLTATVSTSPSGYVSIRH